HLQGIAAYPISLFLQRCIVFSESAQGAPLILMDQHTAVDIQPSNPSPRKKRGSALFHRIHRAVVLTDMGR
ncbi:MAG: hypothetical protein KDJ99_24440, partial [Candidatus Competibacteraceae bacterium]|nr:hypothetical protein [Candidatus Competibacteraceae bacterium]